ncbi:MAG: enoyl-CoA hydratase [Gammaproteobacteria bacterium]|jgi:enoyl-CoA hydratase
MTSKILVDKRDGVGWVTINNPARRNAISLEMWEAMGAAFADFSADGAIRCAVIHGSGDKAFASGADISQFEKNRSNAAASEAYGKISKGVRDQIMTFDKPLIAMVRGFCMGGGLGLAMTADMRISADDGVYAVPAARLSIAYDAVNLGNLVHLVGPSKAKEILLTAKRYSAAEALQMGLVNSVVPVAELEAAVADITDRLVDNAPLSMRATKLTVNELIRDAALRNEELLDSLITTCFNSADYTEGRKAFMEKRKPVFTGK